ncbi:hypothetical protein KAR52_03365 [Candidatus Pacearchaeota archaeon]|nr:hypothetical protein [Candidatus Pacearchaeota archaeon]
MSLDFLLVSIDFINLPLFEEKTLFKPNGVVENISIDKNKDTFKTYSDLINNNLSFGFQPNGVEHDDYKDLGIFEFGPLYPINFNK